jgi:hypothetical protein
MCEESFEFISVEKELTVGVFSLAAVAVGAAASSAGSSVDFSVAKRKEVQ